MAYGDLYQRRRPAPLDLTGSFPQSVEQSHVERMRRLNPPNIDASAGLNEAERRQVKEIQRLIASGLWGVGNVIPTKLMAAVMDGCAPQSAPFLLEAASDPAARIARQITASMSMREPLATDRDHPRNLATDQVGRPRNDIAPDHAELRRPTMSYELERVLGDWDYMSEDDFDASMKQLDITDTTRRIALKQEALACGVMRARGTRNTRAWPPRQYRPMPGMDDPNTQHFVDKDSKEATKSTAGNPFTIQACDASGRCAYDGTGIEFL